ADWVIDLGPDGGARGGRLVAEGPPERIAAAAGSWTGELLRDVLARDEVAPAAGASEPARGEAAILAPARRRAPPAISSRRPSVRRLATRACGARALLVVGSIHAA